MKPSSQWLRCQRVSKVRCYLEMQGSFVKELCMLLLSSLETVPLNRPTLLGNMARGKDQQIGRCVRWGYSSSVGRNSELFDKRREVTVHRFPDCCMRLRVNLLVQNRSAPLLLHTLRMLMMTGKAWWSSSSTSKASIRVEAPHRAIIR